MLRAGKARLERSERKLAAEVSKRQQFLAGRRERSETASRQLAKGDDSLRSPVYGLLHDSIVGRVV